MSETLQTTTGVTPDGETTDKPSFTRKLMPKIAAGLTLYDRAGALLSKFGEPLFLLWLRVFIAMVFFKSGLQKLQDWDSTVYLFAEYYQVPILPPNLAAVSGTAFELLMPVALVLGLFTRLSAVPLLVMALVIQYSLGARDPDFNSWEHIVWITALVALIIRGPGLIAIDPWLVKFFGKKQDAEPATDQS